MCPSEYSPNQPRVGITFGDPAGIGPEIVLKSAAEARCRSACRLVILADAAELRRQARLLNLPCDYPVVHEDVHEETLAADGSSEVVICDVGAVGADVRFGALSAVSGRAAVLCLDGRLDALATAPIHKESLRLAGSPFPGHTEMLAALCQGETPRAYQPLMCFFAGPLRVVLLSIHVSLGEAIRAVTRDRVIHVIALTHEEMKRFGLANPRIAVCGLNPHAGEHGLFGDEEIEVINPAVEHCRTALGIDVRGAFPADTLFRRAQRGEFDVVVACYHDQGLVAVKSLAFGEAVNVTLGLPIIRTSVDHGTAFDIAGQGVADPQSMIEAICLAARLSSSLKQ